MTTIDRAGLANEIERVVNEAPDCATGMFVVLKRDEWREIAAALRKPDQKGEAGGLRAVIHDWIRDDVPLAGKMNLLPTHVDALMVKIVAALQPAPEAGKLPSEEEIARAICATIHADPDYTPPYPGHLPIWMKYRREAKAVAALLSPAQPHDVPAGDGDGLEALWTSRFPRGALVRKPEGGKSEWQGRVVGTYCPSGGAWGAVVESDHHRGSSQLYPDVLLEEVPQDGRASRSTSGRA